MLLARKTLGWSPAWSKAWLALSLAWAVFFCAAPAPAAPSDGSDLRNDKYLFIVDTSRASKGLKTPLQQALGELVSGGLEGWMHNGDTYGLWTFAERLSTTYPMQTWREKDRGYQADQATQLIEKAEFAKRGRLKSIFPHMFSVIGTVKDVTVVILTDGDDPVEGTEFDPAIKTALSKVKEDLRRAHKPTIMVLVAKGGRVVRWGVNSPEMLVPLPKAPPRPPAPPPGLAGTTNATPRPQNPTATTGTALAAAKPGPGTIASNAASLTTPTHDGSSPAVATKLPPKPVTSRAPIIMTKETVNAKTWLAPLDGSPPAAAPAAPPPGSTNPPAPVAPVATSPSPAPPPPPPAAEQPPKVLPTPPQTNLLAAATTTNAPAPALSAPSVPSVLAQPLAPTGQTLAATAPTGVVQVPVQPERQPDPAVALAPVTPAPPTSAQGSTLPGTILIALGAMCTGLAFGLLLMRRRTTRQQPSLITRSLGLARGVAPAQPEKGRPAVVPPEPAPLTTVSPQG